jgi:hypothetical protein
LVEICGQSEVRHFEDWRVGIGIDCNDVAGLGHTREMVARAADPAGEVERRGDRLAGLPHLALAIDPAEIDCDATRRNTRVQNPRDSRELLETVGSAEPASTPDAASTRDDAIRIANVDLTGIGRDVALEVDWFLSNLH